MTTHRNVFLLACSQALLLTNAVTLIAANSLVGYLIAPDKTLATLPQTAYVIGMALSTFPASFWMQRVGRRNGFITGAAFGAIGAALAAWGVASASFALFCFAMLPLGVYNAFGQYYRFAAADASAPDFRAKAISFVLAGGLVGGIVGPTMSRYTRSLGQPEYFATYASLIAVAAIAIVVLSLLRIPRAAGDTDATSVRPLRTIARQPAFIVAVATGALTYAVMNLLMTATPLAMSFCGHPYDATAGVISAHVVAMFAPSFFTGSLIKRFGVLQVMLAGMALLFACTGIALSGQAVSNFWWALVMLGVGWNFGYIGATTLLTETYRPAERAKAQGVNEFTVFGVQAISAFSSGVLVNAAGWNTLNFIAIALVAAASGASLWLLATRRRTRAAPSAS